MKAVIMAGGRGTRLRPVTGLSPKPMALLMGKPVMEHIINLLRDSGFDELCAALGYGAGEIMDYFGDGSKFGVKLQYRREQSPLGTAGAVKNCADFYGDEDFLVISADAACDFDLAYLMAEHKKQAAALTLALHKNPLPLRYGLALTDPTGRILRFIEKPRWPQVVTDRVNTGIYAISPRVMSLVPEGAAMDFGKELFPLLLTRGEKLMGLPMSGYFCDIGTPLSYYQCCIDAIQGRLKIPLPEGMAAKPPEEKAEDEDEPGLCLTVPCKSRAGLMELFASELMELGADYSDGIRLRGSGCELHIFPSSAQSALRISVQGGGSDRAGALLSGFEAAVQALES